MGPAVPLLFAGPYATRNAGTISIASLCITIILEKAKQLRRGSDLFAVAHTLSCLRLRLGGLRSRAGMPLVSRYDAEVSESPNPGSRLLPA